jgi:hypothetical protein
MKHVAGNILAYTGTITLSQYIGSKKTIVARLHNKGGKPLFDFLADCFTGDFTSAKAALPKKIMTYTKTKAEDDTEVFVYSSTHYLLSAAKKVSSTENGSAVCFSFSIPYDDIRGLDQSNSFKNAYIGLYTANVSTTDCKNYLAEFSLESLMENATLALNYSVVVDWVLNITNVSTQQDSGAI